MARKNCPYTHDPDWQLAIYDANLVTWQGLHSHAVNLDNQERLRVRVAIFPEAVEPFKKLRRADQVILANTLSVLFGT